MAEILVSEPAGFGIASVLPRVGVTPEALGAALGFAVVSAPVASGDADLMVLGTGPDQWLARSVAAPPDWAEALGERLAGTASVVDQSGAYTVLQITGADARHCLQKGLPVDLSPSACPPGTVIVGAIAHIGVIVHHVVPDRFHCFVFRSFTGSFREWLDTTIAAL